MELLHPGVYIQEVSSGVQPIEGVSTSTTGFIGKAQMGPLDSAQLVTSFAEFQDRFGGFLSDGFLAHAAMQFFNTRGRRLYVVRVARDATTASVTLADREAAAQATLTIAAASPGAWPDDLSIVIGDGTLDPVNELKLQITRQGAVVETFDDLSMNPDASNFIERAIGAASQLVTAAAASIDTTVNGTSVSAATAGTALPADRRNLLIDVNGDGPQLVALADPVTSGGEIATAIANAVQALTPQRSSTDPAAFNGFTAAFAGGAYTLTSGTAGRRSSVRVTNAPSGNAATLLALGVLNGGAEATGAAALRPAAGTFALSGAVVGGAVTASTAGSDGITPQDSDFIAGFTALDTVQDVNILAVPGIGTGPVVDFGTNYCTQRQDCFFIGDMAPMKKQSWRWVQ
jgi:uncharacterized protein